MIVKRDIQGRFIKGNQGRLGVGHSRASKKLMSEHRKGKMMGKFNPHWNPNRHSDERIECACGCGNVIPKYDRKGRLNKWIVGHQARGKSRPDVTIKLRELRANGRLKPRRGNQHWNWKGGITPLIRLLRQTREYREWRLAVYARDKWTCQECERHCNSKNIVAHHKKSFKKYPGLRYRVENGITLCRKCHLKNHKTATYGAS